MNTPIVPSAPVSPIITIQPVAPHVPNPEAGANPLANVPTGTLVEGFVVNRDGQNNPILRTPIGDLRVTSEVFLKTGSEVVFRVDTSQASLARILTVDGLNPQDYNAQNNARSLLTDTVSTSALLPNLARAGAMAMPQPTATPMLAAMLLQATPPSPLLTSLQATQTLPFLAQLRALRPGATLRMTVYDLQLPPSPVAVRDVPESPHLQGLLPPKLPLSMNQGGEAAKAMPLPLLAAEMEAAHPQAAGAGVARAQARPEVPTAPAPPAPAPANPAAPRATPEHSPEAATTRPTPDAPTAAPTTRAPIPAAAMHAYGMSAPRPPMMAAPMAAAAQATPLTAPHPAAPAAPAAALPPDQLEAQVIGHEADGANILHTAVASLKVYTPQPLPTGTSLRIRLEAAPAAEGAPPTSVTGTTAETGDAEGWEPLGQALKRLEATAPDDARDLSARLPAPNARLTSHLLTFFTAIKTGDIEAALPRRLWRALEVASPDILAKLRRNGEALEALPSAAPGNPWQAFSLPMLVGGQLQAVTLYLHRDKEEQASDEAARRAQGQRFILEVGLSEIGAMQFDGFVRAREVKQSFDLVVRCARPLDAPLAQDIRDIFDTSLKTTGLVGQLVFQHGAEYFVRPVAKPTAIQGGVVA